MSQETKFSVLNFYEDDEYSRLLPGKKDYISISKNVHKQKRLILSTIHERYCAFKEKNSNSKIGFSKFCELNFTFWGKKPQNLVSLR